MILHRCVELQHSQLEALLNFAQTCLSTELGKLSFGAKRNTPSHPTFFAIIRSHLEFTIRKSQRVITTLLARRQSKIGNIPAIWRAGC